MRRDSSGLDTAGTGSFVEAPSRACSSKARASNPSCCHFLSPRLRMIQIIERWSNRAGSWLGGGPAAFTTTPYLLRTFSFMPRLTSCRSSWSFSAAAFCSNTFSASEESSTFWLKSTSIISTSEIAATTMSMSREQSARIDCFGGSSRSAAFRLLSTSRMFSRHSGLP